MSATPAPRSLSAPLPAAILCWPALAGWLLLRRGYSRSPRVAVLTYALVMTAVGLLGQLSR